MWIRAKRIKAQDIENYTTEEEMILDDNLPLIQSSGHRPLGADDQPAPSGLIDTDLQLKSAWSNLTDSDGLIGHGADWTFN